MLRNKDSLIKDLTNLTSSHALEAIISQFETSDLFKIEQEVQSMLSVEHDKLKPIEDEVLNKFGESTTRHKLHAILSSIHIIKRDFSNHDEEQKKIINAAREYMEAGKLYIKLKWINEALKDNIKERTEHKDKFMKRDLNAAVIVEMSLKNETDLETLFKYGADIYYRDEENKQNFLHYAASYGLDAIVKYLIKNGLKVTARSADGSTPLHLASSEAMVNTLIGEDADVDAVNFNNETPLLIAISKAKNDNSFLSVVKKLFDYTPNVNGKDRHHKTVFHYATEIGDKELMITLACMGANVNAKDEKGNTVLHHFANNADMVSHLISLDADVTARNHEGEIPLHKCDPSNINAFKMLCTLTTVNIRNCNGQSALHKCVTANNLNALQCVLETEGANIDIRNNRGETPLYCAVQKNIESYSGDYFADLVTDLIRRGADLDAKNNQGESPRDLFIKANDDVNKYIPKSAVIEVKGTSGTITDAINTSGGSPVFSSSASRKNPLELNSSSRSRSPLTSPDSSDDDSDFRPKAP